MIEKLYTVEEVAELASVTGRTIRNYLKSGRLKGRKIGGQWRFPESEVQHLLTGAGRAQPPAAPTQAAQQPQAGQPPEGSTAGYDDMEEDYEYDESDDYRQYTTAAQPYAPAPAPAGAQPPFAAQQAGAGAAPPYAEPATLPPPAVPPGQPSAAVAAGQPTHAYAAAPEQMPSGPAGAAVPGYAPAGGPYAPAGQPYAAPPAYAPPQGALPVYPPAPAYPAQQPLPYYQPAPAGQPQYAPYPAQPGGQPPLQPPPAGYEGGSAPGAGGAPQSQTTQTQASAEPPPSQQAPQPPQNQPDDADADNAQDFAPALSDVGKRVAQFATEVHDCAEGPQVCAMIDLYQSFASAKTTSQRIAELAAQESEQGIPCQSFVEFDARYYIARYTLFGSSVFLNRCLTLIG